MKVKELFFEKWLCIKDTGLINRNSIVFFKAVYKNLGFYDVFYEKKPVHTKIHISVLKEYFRKL